MEEVNIIDIPDISKDKIRQMFITQKQAEIAMRNYLQGIMDAMGVTGTYVFDIEKLQFVKKV